MTRLRERNYTGRMIENEWWSYVVQVAGDVQYKEIADRAGFDKSNVTRWKQGANADPLFVVKFARAYGRPVAEALVASGLITSQEASVTEVRVGIQDALDSASDEELIDALRRRLAATKRPAKRSPGRVVLLPGIDVSALTDDEINSLDKAAGTDESDPREDDVD